MSFTKFKTPLAYCLFLIGISFVVVDGQNERPIPSYPPSLDGPLSARPMDSDDIGPRKSSPRPKGDSDPEQRTTQPMRPDGMEEDPKDGTGQGDSSTPRHEDDSDPEQRPTQPMRPDGMEKDPRPKDGSDTEHNPTTEPPMRPGGGDDSGRAEEKNEDIPANTPPVVDTGSTRTECDGEVDCNGDCDGRAILNHCQVCVGGKTHKPRDSGIDQCQQCIFHDDYVNRMDCNEDCGGEAYENGCGVCIGGNTRRRVDSGIDSCGQCRSGGVVSIKDCAGVCDGDAWTDKCGDCVGGTTGVSVDKNRHRIDCLGQCEREDGRRYIENDCGDCVRAPADGSELPTAMDCDGTCNTGRQRAKWDETCGICYGEETGIEKDSLRNVCDVCINEDEAARTFCFGCDYEPNSGLVEDACGSCGGDGSGCQTLESIKPKMLPNSGRQEITVFGAGFLDSSRSASDGVSCIISSPTSNLTVKWPVSDLTNTAVTCQSEGDPLVKGVYEISVRKDGEVITGGEEPIQLTVYQPPEIVSVDPREFDAIEGGPLNFEIHVNFLDTAQLTQYMELVPVPKLIVRGNKLNKVLDVDDEDKAVLKGIFSSDTRLSFNVELKKYSSKTFTVQPSFDGLLPLPGGEDGFEVTVFTEGPGLESVRMQNNGDGVKVNFNRNINTDELQTCDAIFHDVDRLLGTGAECEWNSLQSLVVRFGEDAELDTGDSLRVRSGAIHGFGQEHSKEPEDVEVEVEGPRNAEAPVAIMEVASEISSCGKLEVRGEKSRGGGKRGLKCRWTITTDGDVDTTELQRQLDDGVNSDEDGRGGKSFELEGDAIDPNVEYELTLDVENDLGIRHNVSRSFRKASEPKPTVTIKVKNADAQAARVSQALTLSAEVEYQEGCFDVGITNFEWAWDNQDADIDEKNRFSRNLWIPAKSLPGRETIRFIVNVSREGDSSKYTTDFIDINTVNSDLKSNVHGSSSRQVGCSSGPVELDGSRSSDPDEEAYEMVYEWICEQITDGLPCYSYREDEEGDMFPSDEQRGNRTLGFMSEQMEPEKDYLFTLQVQKVSRFATAEVTMRCSEEEPLEIELSVDDNKDNKDEGVYNSDDNIDIKAIIRSDLPVTDFTWETDVSQSGVAVGGDALAYLDLRDMDNLRGGPNINNKESRGVSVAHLNLKGGALAKDARYKFRITANTEDGRTGTSTINIRTRAGIKGCEVNILNDYTPLEKVEYEIKGCTADEDDQPLSYQILRRDTIAGDSDTDSEERTVVSTISQPNNEPRFEAFATAPGDGQTHVDLTILICGKTGSRLAVDKTRDVVERDSPLSNEEKDEFLEKNVKEETQKGNLFEALLGLNAFLSTERRTTSGGRRRKRNTDQDMAQYASSQTDLLGQVQSEGNLGPSERQAVLDQTIFLAFEHMNSTTRTKAVETIRKLLEDSDESSESEPMDIDRGRNILNSLGNAADGINLQEERELADEIRSAQQLAMKELSRGLSFGDEFEEETSDGYFKAVRSQLGESLSSHSGDGSASVDFGDTLKDRYGTDWDCDDGRTSCSDVIVKFSQYKDGIDYLSFNEEDASTLIADIIDIAIADPETGDDIEISDLPIPVTIEIPIKEIPEGKRAVGKFMNKETAAWESDGVETTVSDDNQIVTIASIHLTEFTVVTEDAGDESTEGSEMGGNTETGDSSPQVTDSNVNVETEDADDDSKPVFVIVIVLVIAFILLVVVTAIVWTRVKKRKRVSPTPSNENMNG